MGKSHIICGIDEVGRGPLAGPVMAACVIIPESASALPFWEEVTDSKKLSAKKRDALYPLILQHAICGIGECSPAEIDDLNIHHATLLAMKRAFYACCHPERSEGYHVGKQVPSDISCLPDDALVALIDGKFCPDIPCEARAVIQGDSKHGQIGAAFISAKVTRDRQMATLDKIHPEYGGLKNAAYGTAQHRAAIAEFGITEYHRKSFAPCRDKPLKRVKA